jgi:DNA polymerase III subunit gamma/tau
VSSYQVLARKWRPIQFSDVKGQDHIIKTIKNSILNNRVAAAYLFSGTRGVGKTSVARLLAKALCCTNLKDGEPCNKCQSCIEITNGSSIDIQEIDGASNNGVDNVRDIRDNILYPPVSSKYKIYIIDEVHMLSTSAFNALLKTLEEPPPHGIFILATTEMGKIPQTIVSRCQSFDFKKLSVDAIAATLKDIVIKENVSATSTSLHAIAREARGSLRDSLSMLDKVISFAGNKFDDNEVRNILGFVDRNMISGLASGIIKNDVRGCLTLSKKLFDEAYDVKNVTDTLVEMFRNMLFVKNGLSDMLAEELPDYELKELETATAKISSTDIEQWFYMTNNCAEEVARSAYPWIIFDVSLISMCSKPSNESLVDLINVLKNAPTTTIATSATSATSATVGNIEKKNVKTFDWNELLNKISTVSPQVSDVLSKAKFTGLKQGKTILLDYSDTPDLVGLNQDFFRSLEETVYELYGSLYRIEIVNSVIMQRVANNDIRKKLLLEKEAVKDAQEILGAKIEKVNLF